MRKKLFFSVLVLLTVYCFVFNVVAENSQSDYKHGEFLIITEYKWDDKIMQDELTFLPDYSVTKIFDFKDDTENKQINVYLIILKDKTKHAEVYDLLKEETIIWKVQLNYIYEPAVEIKMRDPKKGDINEDKEIDATDLIIIKEYILNQVVLNPIGKSNADIDNNGQIDATDYIFIKRHLLKIATISNDGYYLGEDISYYRTSFDNELELRIKSDYIKTIIKKDMYTEDDIIIQNLMGPFYNCYIMKIASADMEFPLEISKETVADVDFISRTGQKLTVWKDGVFYSLTEAYEQQILSKKDVIITSIIYYNSDPELINFK